MAWHDHELQTSKRVLGEAGLRDSVEIVRSLSRKIGFAERFDLLGFDVLDVGHVLQTTGDAERGLLSDGESEALEERGDDDGVGDAGFILKADKNETAGGAGTLTADDGTGDGDELAVGDVFQVFRRADTGEAIAEQ